eukprot:GHRQ01031208.1.p4 GENE.GHRQ01031208.1~~GHRQ01031208.1.p4  ORF type:complete len:136 (+),score=19.74 GHRQ01031208.1:593-1000(+)
MPQTRTLLQVNCNRQHPHRRWGRYPCVYSAGLLVQLTQSGWCWGSAFPQVCTRRQKPSYMSWATDPHMSFCNIRIQLTMTGASCQKPAQEKSEQQQQPQPVFGGARSDARQQQPRRSGAPVYSGARVKPSAAQIA